MAYADGDDLVARYDIDLVGDYCQDSRTTLDSGDVPTNANVLAALDDASGEMDSALLVGGKYTPSQLTGLTGNALSHRKRICCAIAMSLLIQRRGRIDDERGNAIAKEAREHLKALKTGENIFGLASVIDAGIQELATPSSVQIEGLNLITQRMDRFFPGTQQRMPDGR